MVLDISSEYKYRAVNKYRAVTKYELSSCQCKKGQQKVAKHSALHKKDSAYGFRTTFELSTFTLPQNDELGLIHTIEPVIPSC
jgi:hypothetical protein